MIGGIGSSTALSQMASTLFSKLDSKNQGYVEQSDMESAFSVLKTDSSSTSVEDIFNTLDGDGDGKITEAEFSSSLQSLVDELESQFKSSQSGTMSGMPPPPPPPAEGDAGYTQEELTAMAEEVAATDSNLSTLMSSIAADFETADADGDGKVNQAEAMAYQSQAATASSVSGSSGSSSDGTSSSGSSSDTSSADVLRQVMQLLRTYGQSEDDDKYTTLLAEA